MAISKKHHRRRHRSNFGRVVKGVSAGIAVGMVVGSVGSMFLRNNKNVKRKASKAIEAVGNVIDNVQYMMK